MLQTEDLTERIMLLTFGNLWEKRIFTLFLYNLSGSRVNMYMAMSWIFGLEIIHLSIISTLTWGKGRKTLHSRKDEIMLMQVGFQQSQYTVQ